MNSAYLSLGSNEGNRQLMLGNALNLIPIAAGPVTHSSSYYETKAWGITDQPDFINLCILIKTRLDAEQLLKTLLEIETQLGRHRTQKWGPRTIDIDILFYNSDVIDMPDIQIPHPFLQERRFILVPLAEIAPDFVHPVFNKTIIQLLAECPDKLELHKMDVTTQD